MSMYLLQCACKKKQLKSENQKIYRKKNITMLNSESSIELAVK